MADAARIQPLALIDKCIGSKIWVIMKVGNQSGNSMFSPDESQPGYVSYYSLRRIALTSPCLFSFSDYFPSCSCVAFSVRSTLVTLNLQLYLYLHNDCIRFSMQGDKELVGTLRGFDEYVNMVMDDAVQIESGPYGRKETKLGQILLNNANVALIVPGGSPA